MSLFKLRGDLSRQQSWVLGIVGFVFLLVLWWFGAEMLAEDKPVIKGFENKVKSTIGMTPEQIKSYSDSLALTDSIAYSNATEFKRVYPMLPRPDQVLKSFKPLYEKANLKEETWRSIWLNIRGYFWAVLISIVFGFIIGLLPIFSGLFSKPVEAMRYLPLTALIGLFILWFGIDDGMKIAFLAFGIIVYLLPVVVQRVREVKDVYLKTVFTLGATDWQTVTSVFIPAVMSKLIDDIRVLTAISWTYIIIIEYVNKQGGIGALIWTMQRQGQKASMFAILIIIIIIGFLQDRIFAYLDKRMFPHKHYSTALSGVKETQYAIYMILGALSLLIFLGMIPALAGILQTLAMIVVASGILFIIYGEFKILQSSKVNG